MGLEQLLEVVLEPKFGMQLGPVVCRPDKGEEDHEVLEHRPVECPPERL